jgi:hypothetical protein
MRLERICGGDIIMGGDITMQAAGTITNGISKILAEHLLIFDTPPVGFLFSPPLCQLLVFPHVLGNRRCCTASRILGPRTRNIPPTSNMQQKHKNRCNEYN